MITKELICSLLEYQDGKLFWKISGNGRTIGKEAGSVSSNGYRHVWINYKQYQTHRLVYLMFNESISVFVDHIDGDISNNKIENLREANHNENQFNRKIDCRNKTGVKNVHKKGNKYRVAFTFHKKTIHCGYYNTLEEATEVAKIKRQQLHKEFARHE